MNFANAGIPVTVFEVSQDALDHGMEIIRKNYAATVSKGRLSSTAMDTRLALITPTTSYEDLGKADLVIEAVFEEMQLKQEIFKTLDAKT
jgi:3-hydroxyacyl-CoA dehydrogenase